MKQDIHKKIYFHILSWIGFFLIILFSAEKVDEIFLLKSMSNIIPPFFLFYSLIFWVFPNYFKGKLNVKTILITASLAIATVYLRPIFIKTVGAAFFKPFLNDLYVQKMDIPIDRITFWLQFRYNILFVGIAFAYHYASELIKGEHERKALEKENADAKLALLKNQINPHFLYNTLSMVYSKALPLSEDLAEMINQLSTLLRYSIAEADTEGKVLLPEEIKYIEHYIALHEARFNIQGFCDIKISGEVGNYRIAPMLLICFIENSFKHGNPDSPIYIRINVHNDQLFFTVENEVLNGTKDKSSGIGIQNVKSRLELLYPGRHSLVISQNDTIYSAKLKLW